MQTVFALRNLTYPSPNNGRDFPNQSGILLPPFFFCWEGFLIQRRNFDHAHSGGEPDTLSAVFIRIEHHMEKFYCQVLYPICTTISDAPQSVQEFPILYFLLGGIRRKSAGFPQSYLRTNIVCKYIKFCATCTESSHMVSFVYTRAMSVYISIILQAKESNLILLLVLSPEVLSLCGFPVQWLQTLVNHYSTTYGI